LGDKLEKALYFFVQRGPLSHLHDTLRQMFPVTFEKETELDKLVM
jgi:hypothetical protein